MIFLERSFWQLLNGGMAMGLLWLFTYSGDAAPSWAYFLAFMIGNEYGNRRCARIEMERKLGWKT